MDKLTAIRIKYNDGTYSDQIPVGVQAGNVIWDSTHSLTDILGNVDFSNKGNIQNQINQLFVDKVDSSELTNYVNTQLSEDVTNWLEENITETGSAIMVDASLSIRGAAADAKATGDAITNVNGRLEYYQKSLVTSVTNGKYIVASTGGEGSNANCATSGHIPVWHLRGNGIVISSYLWQAAGYAFYDSSGTYITGESANSLSLTVSAGQVTAYKTTVPPSAYTLRVTLHASTYANNASKYFYTLSESDAKKWVIIGDSYATGYTPDGSTTGWVPTTMASIGLTSSDYELICEGGAGFLNGGNQSALTFEGLLGTATLGKSEVGHILVCGGYNDYSRTYAQMQTAFNSFYSAARAKYPFAKIQLGMVSYSTNSDIESALLKVTRLAFLGMNSNVGVEYLSGVEFALSDDDMSTDGVHPKQIGATKVGMSVANAILTGSASGKNYGSVIDEIDGRLTQLDERVAALEAGGGEEVPVFDSTEF